MARGRSVRLYLAEGSATGILTAEIVNWTGHVLACPRTRLEVALKEREELRRTGVYILIGEGAGELPAVYIGEGDDIAARLRSHSRDDAKDFWDRFVAVTSKDMNLTKAHVKYLEGRLIGLLSKARKSDIQNRTEPGFDRLPEADIADMETFLEELQLILPVVGIDVFRQPRTIEPPKPSSPEITVPEARFYVRHTAKGISATALEIDGEFVVLSGSTGSTVQSQSFPDKLRVLREQALASGRIVAEGTGNFRLQSDIAFSSPSSAAVFLFGTSRNGRTDCLLAENSMTYGAWKDAMIDAAQ